MASPGLRVSFFALEGPWGTKNSQDFVTGAAASPPEAEKNHDPNLNQDIFCLFWHYLYPQTAGCS